MKLKDILSISQNSNNKQCNWHLKKKKLKELDMTEEDVLNIIIKPKW